MLATSATSMVPPLNRPTNDIDNSNRHLTSNAKTIDMNTEIKWLGEIAGGYKFISDDDLHRSQDDDTIDNSETKDDKAIKAFCILKLGERLIHKSLPAEGGLNPIWTVSTGAFFIFSATPSALIHEKLQISVYTKKVDPLVLIETIHMIGKSEIDLSDVLISHGKNEERYEVCLHDDDSDMERGTLTLRFRLAIPSDERFLSLLRNKPELLKQPSKRAIATANLSDYDVANNEIVKSLLVTETNETKVASESFMHVLSSAFTTKTKFDKTSGSSVVLVKPFPDPANVKETTYLSSQELQKLTMLPSNEWIEAGSGKVGKVYLEILSCKDLPNVDVGQAIGNLTDCFISAVFEDAMVQTNVIDDELSPHWLPWTQRAFILKMMHPASTLYIAAFDYDLGISKHEPLGRVAVNISSFQPGTDYTLTYKLYPSANVTDRTAAGSIMIRVRIEYNDEREALLAALRPRPTFHINVRKEKSLQVLRYTCFGEYGDDNEHPFDLTVTRSYVNEIFEYKRNIVYCIGDALRSLIYWRPQVRVAKIYLPLHSFLFFCSATTLVERPYLAPSFLLLSIAWIMIASHTLRMQHPSPWHRCQPLRYYFNILRTGKSPRLVRSIKVNQGAKESEKYEKEWERRLEQDTMLAAKQYEMQQEIASIGDESIHTKVPLGIPLDMIVRLTRYQGIVGRMCKKMRLVKSIVTWEEGAVSFWLTLTFLTAGIVSLLLPWLFILQWGSRIIVWGLFGPQMMLLDWWLRVEGKDEAALQKAVENFKKDSWIARIRRQEALKLRDMKCLAFGKYITLIPSHNLSRHFDRPLPSSSARIHSSGMKEEKIAPLGIPGQQLFGAILPRSESESIQCQQEFNKLPELYSDISNFIREIKESEYGSFVQKVLSKLRDDDDGPCGDSYDMVPCKNDNDESLDEGFREVLPTCTTIEYLDENSNVAIVQNYSTTTTEFKQQKSLTSLEKDNTQSKSYAMKRTSSKQPGCLSAELSAYPILTVKGASISRTHSWSVGDQRNNNGKSMRRHIPTMLETDEDRECGDVELVLTPLSPVREDPNLEDDEELDPVHKTLDNINVLYVPDIQNASESKTDDDSLDELGSLFESDTEGNDMQTLPTIPSFRSQDMDVQSCRSLDVADVPMLEPIVDVQI
jgi:C2 domain